MADVMDNKKENEETAVSQETVAPQKTADKEDRETERRIAKAQGEITRSVKQAEHNANTITAEMGYGEEYRKKLLAEEARRLEEARMLEEQKIIDAEQEARKAREEERLAAIEKEKELLRQRSEESDELIRLVKSDSRPVVAPTAEEEKPAEPVEEPVAEPTVKEDEPLTIKHPGATLGDSVITVSVPATVINISAQPQPVQGGVYYGMPYMPYIQPNAQPQATVGSARAQANGDVPTTEELSDIAIAEKDVEYCEFDIDSDMSKAQFVVIAKDAVKRLRKIDKDIKKIEKREPKAFGAEARRLFNERLALEKEAVDILCATLVGAVQVKDRTQIARFKKILSGRIVRYNIVLRDVALATGTQIPLLSRSIPKDIVAGRPYQKTRSIYYSDLSDNEDELNLRNISTKELARLEKEEMRDAALIEEENSRLEKMVSDSLTGIVLPENEQQKLENKLRSLCEQRERDEQIITKRFEYLIRSAKDERDRGRYFFSVGKKTRRKDVKIANERIKRLKRALKYAKKFETLDNDRYYEIAALDTGRVSFGKRSADRSELEVLRSQIDELLMKRDEMNRTLDMLYAGTADSDRYKTKEDIKCAEARLKAIKKAYKKQKPLYKALERKHVKTYMKEKMYDLMNEKTEEYGNAAENAMRARLTRGKYNKDYVMESKRAAKNIAKLDRKIRKYTKRVRKSIIRHQTRILQLCWLVFVLVLAGAGFAVYKIYGSQIAAFIRDLLAKYWI